MRWKLADDPRRVPDRARGYLGRWVYLLSGDGYWLVGVAIDARAAFRGWRHCRDHNMRRVLRDGGWLVTSEWVFEILCECEGRRDAKAEAERRRRVCRWALGGKELQFRAKNVKF